MQSVLFLYQKMLVKSSISVNAFLSQFVLVFNETLMLRLASRQVVMLGIDKGFDAG
jgi:hypothetical protein